MARKDGGGKPPKNMNMIGAGEKKTPEEHKNHGNTWEKDYAKVAQREKEKLEKGDKDVSPFAVKQANRKEEVKKEEATKETSKEKDKEKDKDKDRDKDE